MRPRVGSELCVAVLKKDSNYRKLRLGGKGWLNHASYWLGPNHLLVVEVSNYVERYRRFYFRDVQAILVQNSHARLGWNIGFGICACTMLTGLLVSVFSASRDYFFIIGWFIFFFLFAVCLIINTFRGPSCSVHLRTAVQNQKLSGIGRWRKADRLIAALAPLIDAAQNSSPASEQPVAASTSVASGDVADDPNAPPRIVS